MSIGAAVIFLSLVIPAYNESANLRAGVLTRVMDYLAAQGEIVLFSDMDQPTPLTEAAQLLPWFEQGFAVVIGSRGAIRRNAPLWRQFMSRAQVLLRGLILGFERIHDAQCGFKAFRREAIHTILGRLSLYADAADQTVQGATVTSGFDVDWRGEYEVKIKTTS